MDCALSQSHVGAYVDGELSPSLTSQFEAHVAACSVCRAQVELAQRLKCTLRAHAEGVGVPPALRANVHAALRGEARKGRGLQWQQTGVHAASLAAVAAAVFLMTSHPQSVLDAQEAGIALPVFGDIVERHRDRAPTEIEAREPEQVARWAGDNLGLRIRTVAFVGPQVRLVGARLSHVGSRRAAKLYYRVGDQRLTAVVFEATPELRRGLQQAPSVQRQRMGDHEVVYYSVQGYTVPIVEHDGLMYGFTGDLDRQKLLQLVGSARW